MTGNSKSQSAFKLHYLFKSYGDFAEWVDFAYWWSFTGEGSASAACAAALFRYYYVVTVVTRAVARSAGHESCALVKTYELEE